MAERASCWKHEVAWQTVPSISSAIDSHVPHIVEHIGTVFRGPTGGTWSNLELSLFADLLKACVELDPRGGFLAQNNVEEALGQSITHHKLEDTFTMEAQKLKHNK